MKTIEVFDPAMCCSTGVCGASVDPALVRFAADLDWLASEGVSVERFGLSQRPDAFVAHAEVTQALRERGDEALPLIRRLWTEDRVDHDGERFHLSGAKVRPFPCQDPPEVWLGGIAPSELRRVGRLADGWLPSFVGAAEAAGGRIVVERVAAEHDRAIDAEHYGALLPYSIDPVPDEILQLLARRRPGTDPTQLVAVGLPALAARIDEFVEVGFSKFVAVPLADPTGPLDHHLAELSAAVRPLEN